MLAASSKPAASSSKPSISAFSSSTSAQRSGQTASTGSSAFQLSDSDDDLPPSRRAVAGQQQQQQQRSTVSQSKPASGGASSGARRPAGGGAGGADSDEDIESLLSEMDSAMHQAPLRATKLQVRDAPTSYQRSSAALTASTAATSTRAPRAKCYPTLLSCEGGGGGSLSGGGGGCPSLLCTSCDHPVMALRGQVWRDDVADYLFFRNFYPSQDKMRPAMRSAAGSAAYACQCSWQSVGPQGSGSNTINLSALDTGDRSQKPGCSAWNTLRWICAGH